MMNLEIKCPKCSWKPVNEKLWICSCKHIWNTFETGAVCPKCKKRWEDTSCPKCHKWSKHILWYNDLDKLLKLELEKLNTVQENSFIELN